MLLRFDDFINENYEQASAKETTNLLKKYLKEKFNVMFSIRSDASALRIRYVGGPDINLVKSEVERLKYGTFDSMQDLAGIKDSSELGVVLDGKQLREYKFVFVNQTLPEALEYQLTKALSERFNFADIHRVETLEDMTRRFDSVNTIGYWNWRDYMYSKFRDRNFVTDKTDNIVVTGCVTNNQEVSFTYTYLGKSYSTNKFEKIDTIKPTRRVAPIKREATPKLNNIQMIDYSDKSFVVIGSTYEIKDALSNAGGRFNKFLNIDGKKQAGWIFSKRHENDVANILAEYK